MDESVGVQDEEFGYVRRDTYVLAKALTADVKETEAAGSGGPDVTKGGVAVDPSGPRQEDVQARRMTQAPAANHDKAKVRASVVSNSSGGPEVVSRLEKKTSVMKKMSASLSSGPVSEELPQSFQVKYLGSQHARGLWGIKHTRRPVDFLVATAKELKVGTVLPLVRLLVTKEGVNIQPISSQKGDLASDTFYGIDTISYGVQDLVYTRVFSMIVVKDTGSASKQVHPFECHAFVCESRHSARRLTYSLATAFQEYSKAVNAGSVAGKEKVALIKKRFAIDLRSPDEIEADLEEETEA